MDYFKNSDMTLVPELSPRVCASQRAAGCGLRARRCDVRRSTCYAASPVSVRRPAVLWHLAFSPVSPAPCQDRTAQHVWPVPITTTQFITYYPNIPPSFDIFHASESHIFPYTICDKVKETVEYQGQCNRQRLFPLRASWGWRKRWAWII